MPQPLVTFAIATFNRGPILIDCLRKVLANGLPASQFEIILIDNASTDGTGDLVSREFPAAKNLTFIRLARNRGPVAKNLAIRKARGEFIILLDDDAYPLPGAVPQMVRHFRDNPGLAAAVFDVTLPDGAKEASAYPDVFIGAGTGLRRSALEQIGQQTEGRAATGFSPAPCHPVTLSPCHADPAFGLALPRKASPITLSPCPVDATVGLALPRKASPIASSSGQRPIALLPSDFFMQAEEYDLSFRLLDAGYSIERFWDLPLTHLKSPGARIGQRTTGLDVRNNLYLLARYIPEPLCHQLAADWLARYWMMATDRDAGGPAPMWHGRPAHDRERAEAGANWAYQTHKQSYIRGAAEGLAKWAARRAGGRYLLAPATIERIFKFGQIRERLARGTSRLGARTILFADLGKNMLAYFLAARELNLEVRAILDDRLALSGDSSTPDVTTGKPGATGEREYRGIPLVRTSSATTGRVTRGVDMVIVSDLSPVQAPQRAASLRRLIDIPVLDLFSREDSRMQRCQRRGEAHTDTPEQDAAAV